MALLSLGTLDTFTENHYGRELRSKSPATIFEEETRKYPMDYKFDIFLSHSYNDARLTLARLLGLKSILGAFNYSVYVDWIIDTQLHRETVSAETAKWLRCRMDNSKCLLFATSQNSHDSLWMPWELGYKDGNTAKNGQIGMVAVLPIAQYQGETGFEGQEYLGMYPFVDYGLATNSEPRLWINYNGKSVSLDAWLAGTKPK